MLLVMLGGEKGFVRCDAKGERFGESKPPFAPRWTNFVVSTIVGLQTRVSIILPPLPTLA
jgi:hypothetical protein